MNLQTIQKRIEELSSELVTVSNDLAFLLNGEVVRQPVPVVTRIGSFKELRERDVVHFEARFHDICGGRHEAGDYVVDEVEPEHFGGEYSASILLEAHGRVWLNFDKICSEQVVTRVEA